MLTYKINCNILDFFFELYNLFTYLTIDIIYFDSIYKNV